ncbi:hypothetical protein M5689_013779 [Euphorbia peplus]|nr:hypothetical protein M5689_013779 [Euphorbia peplus]
METRSLRIVIVVIISLLLDSRIKNVEGRHGHRHGYVSGIGDPGMRLDGLRVAIEAWNQCNEVGQEIPGMGSPRMADCFHLDRSTSPVKVFHKVHEKDNRIGFLDNSKEPITAQNADIYAAKKEIYLGKKCHVRRKHKAWQFWMIMLKSGNMDTLAAQCPRDGHKSIPFPPEPRFPCFGKGCMNMPLIYHNYTKLVQDDLLKGSFYGTWDLGKKLGSDNTSYFNVTWDKKIGKGSWNFHYLLKSSPNYPWLMLYLRSDATRGFSGGYHYLTRGMSRIIPKSPNFKVKFRLDIKQGGGKNCQFYLMDIGSCWKNNGKPCDGDTTTDVTRYSEMILNPETEARCKTDLKSCPPYHTFSNGTRVHRTDKLRFPYDAYHVWCAPGNAQNLEEPINLCDPYSNPQPQEILQILPHPVWGEYGYPTQKGQGWVGDPTNWELDVGRLSQNLYFYQEPGTKPIERHWPSINLGTEIYMGNDSVAEWTVSGFDILVRN